MPGFVAGFWQAGEAAHATGNANAAVDGHSPFGGLLWLYMQNRGQSGQLVINEVVTSNKTCLTDEILGTPDFVELYNGSSRTVRLKGYGLSDSIKIATSTLFPM